MAHEITPTDIITLAAIFSIGVFFLHAFFYRRILSRLDENPAFGYWLSVTPALVCFWFATLDAHVDLITNSFATLVVLLFSFVAFDMNWPSIFWRNGASRLYSPYPGLTAFLIFPVLGALTVALILVLSMDRPRLVGLRRRWRGKEEACVFPIWRGLRWLAFAVRQRMAGPTSPSR